MTILVVAAHPDDEVLGCGASMAKWAKTGKEVHVVILAEGATSREKERNRKNHLNDISCLAHSAQKSSEILNVKSVELLDYPDNRMDSVDLIDVVKTVENYVEKLKPEVVVTHHFGDLNIDHQITHQAVITACRPMYHQTVKRILSFEVPSATEWQSHTVNNQFNPNWFENISEFLVFKIEALKAYQSEMREWPHPRSLKAVEHLARWRGASIGCDAAEAFMLNRFIN
jgi:N-acetylglucosamine malate deacetylase 1